MGRGYSTGLDAGPGDRWLACLPLHHVASLGVLARAYVTGVPWTVHDALRHRRVARCTRAPKARRSCRWCPRRCGGCSTPARRCTSSGGSSSAARRARPRCGARRSSRRPGRRRVRHDRDLGRLGRSTASRSRAPRRGSADDGEILVRGAMVMRGYRLDPAPDRSRARRRRLAAHRRHRRSSMTGRVRVVDRKKDLVITGGVNVSPTEVEGVLAHHPDGRATCASSASPTTSGASASSRTSWRRRARRATVARRRSATSRATELSAAKLPRELASSTRSRGAASGKPLRRAHCGATP